MNRIRWTKDAFLIILVVIVLGGNVLSKRECLKKILIWSYCYGVAAHGIMMFNKISWHDDLEYGRLLSFDAATGLGRWFRAVLAYVVALMTNGTNLSLPLFHGLLSIFLIALSVFILIQIFNIENVWLQSVLCGLFVTYPVVTSTFAYMFTAPYYFFALFLAVFAVYFDLTRNNIISFAVSSVCICLSLGTYQAYFSVAVSCFVILIITGIVDDSLESVKSIFLQGIRYLSICVCGLVEYYIVWKLFLKVFNISASDYQGLSSIGGAGIDNYLKGIQKAYFAFFQLLKNISPNDINCDLFPIRGARFLEWTVILTCAGISLVLILHVTRKNIYKGLLLACLVGLLPLCFNLIFLMSAASTNSQTHTLMLYSGSMLYVYCIWLLQYIVRGKCELAHDVYRLSAVLMSLLLIMNVYFANTCYLKADLGDANKSLGDEAGVFEWTGGKFINMQVDPVNLANPNTNAIMTYTAVDCVEGDVFVVNAIGAVGGRAWGFIDSGNHVVSMANANVTVKDLMLTAPANASKLIIHNKFDGVTHGHCYKITNNIHNQFVRLTSRVAKSEEKADKIATPSVSLFESIGIIGDSFATGKDGHHNVSWGHILARMAGSTAVIYAKGGLTTQAWLTDELGLTKLNSEAANNLYVIALGINDGNQATTMGTISDVNSDNTNSFYSYYGRVVRAVQAHAPNAVIMLSTIARFEDKYRPYSAAIRAIGAYYELPVLDLDNSEFFMSDFFANTQVSAHPTAVNDAAIAKEYRRLIEDALAINARKYDSYIG